MTSLPTIALWIVLILMAYKTVPELRTAPPQEWAGELAATTVSITVAVTVALALHVALAGGLTFDPQPMPPFVASNVAVPALPVTG